MPISKESPIPNVKVELLLNGDDEAIAIPVTLKDVVVGQDTAPLARMPPQYFVGDEAFKYFSNEYFYADEDLMRLCSRMRKQVFGIMTMRDVLEKWGSKAKQMELAKAIGAGANDVMAALNQVEVEDELHQKIVAINGSEEIETIRVKHVPNVPSPRTAASLLNLNALLNDRAQPIFLVMGPSGSGKTFVSVMEIATHGVELELGHTKHVTLYVKPNSILEYSLLKNDDPQKEKVLMNHIIEVLAAKITGYRGQKLKMHVTIVLDEIVNNDFLETRLTSFLKLHMKNFADAVRLVACGTGLTGESMKTDVDCFKTYLDRWTKSDVEAVLIQRLRVGQEPGPILDAIFDQPVLEALTTNARAAGYLLEEMLTFNNLLVDDYIAEGELLQRLDDAMPVIFATVVSRYAGMNGLQRLTGIERRRVAATVFRAVEDARNCDKLEPPKLKGLNAKEKSVAWSLLDHNIQYSSKMSPSLVREGQRPISVSSAITTILYSMLGASGRIMIGWKAQERISALHVFRQAVLKCLDRFLTNYKEGEISLKSLKNFDNDLAKLMVIQVGEPVPPTNFNLTFSVPKVTQSMIWINGDKAPFADVVAPFELIQCKHSIRKSAQRVDLCNELSKCGLLRNDDANCGGRVVLRAIWALWKGRYKDKDMNLSYRGRRTKKQSVSLEQQQDSLAFPENMLDGTNIGVGDHVECVKVSLMNGDWRFMDGRARSNQLLPDLSHLVNPNLMVESDAKESRISFVLSTNGPRISLFDKKDKICVVCRDDLLEDGRVNKDMLKTSKEKKAWEEFEAKIAYGVDVKFLFT